MITSPPLNGLIPATYSPLDAHGRIVTECIPAYVDFLLRQGVSGLYVCGSTGEGVSLTTEERMRLLEAFVSATARRVPVVVQVGHTSLEDAAALARHAQQIGADAVSAVAPFYYPLGSIDVLMDSLRLIAGAAPELPFYYYHIPVLSRVSIHPADVMERAHDIPTFRGVKFTDPKLHEFLECVNAVGGSMDALWGCDEMMLGALATGARGAVGSTFNIAAAVYLSIIEHFNAGRMNEAREWQARSVAFIRAMARHPFHPAMKSVLRMVGMDLGPCRLPLPTLTREQETCLRTDLDKIGFFEWRVAQKQEMVKA